MILLRRLERPVEADEQDLVLLLARRDRLDRPERHLVVGGEHGVDVGVRLQDVLHRAHRRARGRSCPGPP
jgi:hypothetical protein